MGKFMIGLATLMALGAPAFAQQSTATKTTTSVNDTVSKSLDSVHSDYRGTHPFFNDGAEMPWIIGAVIVLGGGCFVYMKRKESSKKS